MQIVVLGNGYGGIKTALELANVPGISVTLLAATPHFAPYMPVWDCIQPDTPPVSLVSLRSIFNKSLNVTVVQDRAESIEPKKQRVVGQSGRLYPYDFLVCALGKSLPIGKSVAARTKLPHVYNSNGIIATRQMLVTLSRRTRANLAIIGGGISGVELAAAISRHYPQISTHIIERSKRLTNELPVTASTKIRAALEAQSVHIQNGKSAEQLTRHTFELQRVLTAFDGVVWTGGLEPHNFYTDHHTTFSLSKNSGVVVNKYLQAAPQIFVIGDNASVAGAGTAQAALHMAVYVATYISAHAQGRSIPAYRAFRPKYIIRLGGNSYVAVDGDHVRTGLQGWMRRNQASNIIAENFNIVVKA